MGFSGQYSCEHLDKLSSREMRVSRLSPLILLIFTSTAISDDAAERNVLEVELTNESENEIEEAKPTEITETVEVIANEPSDKIKAENIEKCDKCLKSTFRYRHDGFCGKCVSNNIIDVNEQQEINDAMRCKKCKKPKFRSRHLLFCTDNCYEETVTTSTSTTRSSELTTTSKTTPTPPPYIKSDTDIVEDEMIRFKNRAKKQKRREQKRKEKQQRKLLKKQKKKSGQLSDYDEAVRLGPLGNVLKYLIVANTWKDE